MFCFLLALFAGIAVRHCYSGIVASDFFSKKSEAMKNARLRLARAPKNKAQFLAPCLFRSE
ncbi:MAG: hypothetical protein C0507_21225 [Cyanobacteria bacterium PR.3.49]|nr:hypothetical protein [Cyanobacteria bacterium PR.3.49]